MRLGLNSTVSVKNPSGCCICVDQDDLMFSWGTETGAAYYWDTRAVFVREVFVRDFLRSVARFYECLFWWNLPPYIAAFLHMTEQHDWVWRIIGIWMFYCAPRKTKEPRLRCLNLGEEISSRLLLKMWKMCDSGAGMLLAGFVVSCMLLKYSKLLWELATVALWWNSTQI